MAETLADYIVILLELKPNRTRYGIYEAAKVDGKDVTLIEVSEALEALTMAGRIEALTMAGRIGARQVTTYHVKKD